jgi:ketosteroid isomerase-like protein
MTFPRARCAAVAAALSLSFLSALGCRSTQKETPPAVAPAPSPERPEDVQKAILDREAERNRAMIQADAKALGEILRDDLVYIHSNTSVEGKNLVVEEITSGKLHYTSIEPSEVVVRPYGDTAIATGRVLLKFTSLKKPMAFSVRFTEVWLRSHGVWQLASWQAARIPES